MFEEFTQCSKHNQQHFWCRPPHDATEGRLRAMARHYYLSMGTKEDCPHLHFELQKSLTFLNKKEGEWFTKYLNEILQGESTG